jgi:hypothetical protein
VPAGVAPYGELVDRHRPVPAGEILRKVRVGTIGAHAETAEEERLHVRELLRARDVLRLLRSAVGHERVQEVGPGGDRDDRADDDVLPGRAVECWHERRQPRVGAAVGRAEDRDGGRRRVEARIVDDLADEAAEVLTLDVDVREVGLAPGAAESASAVTQDGVALAREPVVVRCHRLVVLPPPVHGDDERVRSRATRDADGRLEQRPVEPAGEKAVAGERSARVGRAVARESRG